MTCNFHISDWVRKSSEKSCDNIEQEADIDDSIDHNPLNRFCVLTESKPQRNYDRSEEQRYHNVNVEANLLWVRLVHDALNSLLLFLRGCSKHRNQQSIQVLRRFREFSLLLCRTFLLANSLTDFHIRQTN